MELTAKGGQTCGFGSAHVGERSITELGGTLGDVVFFVGHVVGGARLGQFGFRHDVVGGVAVGGHFGEEKKGAGFWISMDFFPISKMMMLVSSISKKYRREETSSMGGGPQYKIDSDAP